MRLMRTPVILPSAHRGGASPRSIRGRNGQRAGSGGLPALSPAYPNYLPGARSRQTLRGACGAQGAGLQRNSGERRAADHFDQPAVRALEFAVRIEIGGIRAFPAKQSTLRRDFLERGRSFPTHRSIIAVRRASKSHLPPSSCRSMCLIRTPVISAFRHWEGAVQPDAAPPRTPSRDRRRTGPCGPLAGLRSAIQRVPGPTRHYQHFRAGHAVMSGNSLASGAGVGPATSLIGSTVPLGEFAVRIEHTRDGAWAKAILDCRTGNWRLLADIISRFAIIRSLSPATICEVSPSAAPCHRSVTHL